MGGVAYLTKHEYEAMKGELAILREIQALAQDYVDHYLQDEADDPECCLTNEQHLMARALRDTLEHARTLSAPK